MDRNTRIAVVGAGIGGLTVASFLQREGFQVKIYEQAQEFSRVGAGISFSPNVTKVLRRLGIEDALFEAGIKPDHYVSRAWDTGNIKYQFAIDAEYRERNGGSPLTIHRGDFHATLAQGVASSTVVFDRRLVRLEESKDSIRLVFEKGASVEADIVIGADGLRSKVREHLFGVEPPRFVGAVAYRSIFSADKLRGYEMPDITKWWGPDRHILSYFVRSKRDEVNVMAAVPAAAWESEDASRSSSKKEFTSLFADFHEDIHRVLDAADEVSVWPIYDRQRNDKWSSGRVVLLGDACHAMRPYMGAGGGAAIEDAAILSRCFAMYDDLTEAFHNYEATRIPRVAEIQRISIENSWLAGPTDTDWYFHYDACTAPLATG
jgi:6-hydroxynicotinate 3-monooxygenase